uniref:Uncharacterized protein n=1 Tax=Ganoderma boninense TaxID=34458 RepID=A0A5K1K1A0_9APHY|nr:Eukaryotic translation initiation factor 3 subunit G (eIF3g) (Eukaryotic translation initiation factor 3 RNA-binding subunit) (eIF-3 RNA-binding subunit) (Translation initiation factor eIF3 p33 subunit homolog) (eIF3 p33 homolog) [Ganoderma boninense]
MPPPLPSAPARPILFDIERSSSPPPCEDQAPVVCEGMELTVYGLEHETPRSAADHMRRILRDLKHSPGRDAARDAVFDAVVIRTADTQHCMDYVYLSLSQDRVPQPRADLLQGLRRTLLDTNQSLRAQWRTQSGPDRTRRAFFTADSKSHAEGMKKKLGDWFNGKGYAFYQNYVSKPLGPWRVTFDFFEPAHVDAILAAPFMIDHVKYEARRPRYVTPSYGYQVALLSCRDWVSAKVVLDGWIRHLFQDDPSDPVVYSAMELDGDLYTAVLPSWDHAVHVAGSYRDLEAYLAANPVTEHIKPVPQPGLLYGLNGVGLSVTRQPLNTATSSSSEFTQLRQEFEYTRQQGVEVMSTLFRVSEQNTAAITHLNDQMSTVNANSTALAISQTLGTELLDVSLSLADARRERINATTALLQRDLPPHVIDYHRESIRQCDEDIQQYSSQKRHLQSEIASIHSTLSATLSSRLVAQAQPPPPPTAGSSQPQLQRRSSTASVEDAMQEQFAVSSVSFLVFLSVLVASSSPSISALTINSNGLMNVVKQAKLSDMIMSHNPHVWVVTETKSTMLIQDRIHAPPYHKFESAGRPLSNGRGSKWGIVMGVQRSFPNRSLLTPFFKGAS